MQQKFFPLKVSEALLIIIFFLAIFATFNWDLLTAHGLIPIYDYSANDLLIQDAKRFQLLHGNYSKIGFFHPGPFFLQLMALVEWIGVDLLKIIPSPIAADAWAGALLHATSIAVLYLALRELFMSRLFAIAGTLATLAICRAMLDPGTAFFVGLWMPFLYMAPAILILAACIGLVTTGWRWLPVGILGLCMLGHGHASFIGLAPIMAICAAGALWFLNRTGISPSSLKTLPSNVVLISIAILILFALPIVANTILHFPGEIPKYFRFAGQNQLGGIRAKISYLGHFYYFALLAIPMLFLLPSRLSGIRLKIVIGLVLAASMPAAIFYVLRGLDTLEYLYPVYWAAVFISGSAAIAILGMIKSYGKFRAQAAVVVIIGIISIASVPKSSMTLEVSQPAGEFPAAISAIQKSTPPNTYVWIDVDMSDFQVIFDMATLASLDKRQIHRNFCIVPSTWHIMYPPALRCDLERNPISVRMLARSRDKFPDAAIKFGHTALIPDPQKSMQIGESEVFQPVGSRAIYAEGWSTADTGGRWTDGKNALILIPSSDLPQNFTVRMTFNALVAQALPKQGFTFSDAKGNIIKRLELSTSNPSATVDLALNRSISNNGFTEIHISIDSPRRPSDLGINSDQRELGLLLTRLNIIEN